MQRAVDTGDLHSIQEAKRLIDGASGGSTAWFPDELSDLRGAGAALTRVVESLRRETRIKSVARRLAAAMPPEDRARMDREHPDVPEQIRHLTDWGKVDRAGEGIRMYPSWDRGGRLVWTTDAAKSKRQIEERMRRAK